MRQPLHLGDVVLDKETIHLLMNRALALAEKARGQTSPNPMVGAVIVKNGKVIGEGFHKKAGGPHAEIEALKRAKGNASGGQLFLNLEPCCHYGRTPPCTESIIQSGIREVFIGMKDPNPLVRGKGIKTLRKNGILVHLNYLKKECEKQNEVFIKYIKTGRPFVILKSGLSLDGKIAVSSGQSKWITGLQARKKVHEFRNQVDSIIVGARTILKDNPSLTTRLEGKKGKHPIRIILDNEEIVPLTAKVFKNAKIQQVVYVTSQQASLSRLKRLEGLGVKTWIVSEKNKGVDLTKLMRRIGENGITSVLIEGGGEVNASALKEKIVDKIVWFMAPKIIGGNFAPGVVGGNGVKTLKQALPVKDLMFTPLGNDWMVEGYL